ncbi:MAG: PBS lyase [Desulfobulbaceae bacterium]|nr:PBS lyase [Desulfobulbaceae bacterium]
MKKGKFKTRPWCPFCGQTIGKPKPPVSRKLGEFTIGSCQCGAVYTCDPTGHNVGSAMVEAMVLACNDDWDLAWELMPEDDYLTGRLENYDEQTDQVVEGGYLDGRTIRGVIYFVRLHREIAEIADRFHKKQGSSPGDAAQPADAGLLPELEPARDPRRKRRKTNKLEVRQLVSAGDIDSLVDLAFDDIKVLWFMQRLLYDPEEGSRWRTAHIIGQVCGRLSTRQPGSVSDLLHRLFEACSDSAATNWGLIETIGAIITGRSDMFGAFTRHLLRYTNHPSTRNQVIWAFGTIAELRPDLIRGTSFYQLLHLVEDPDPQLRGLMLRLLGRLRATESISAMERLVDDQTPVSYYENGAPVHTTVGEMASDAIRRTNQPKEKTSE